MLKGSESPPRWRSYLSSVFRAIYDLLVSYQFGIEEAISFVPVIT